MSAAVIFDIDGTLVDSNYQHALAWYPRVSPARCVVPLSGASTARSGWAATS